MQAAIAFASITATGSGGAEPFAGGGHDLAPTITDRQIELQLKQFHHEGELWNRLISEKDYCRIEVKRGIRTVEVLFYSEPDKHILVVARTLRIAGSATDQVSVSRRSEVFSVAPNSDPGHPFDLETWMAHIDSKPPPRENFLSQTTIGISIHHEGRLHTIAAPLAVSDGDDAMRDWLSETVARLIAIDKRSPAPLFEGIFAGATPQ